MTTLAAPGAVRTVSRRHVHLTGIERTFGADEIIVSKTDTKGRITYANRVFMRISGYREDELLGKAHNIIRHPKMPRCVFKFMWDTLFAGNEIFAYVINRCKNGDHYWVFAHVTPTFDSDRRIIGFHSNRRVPDRAAIRKAADLYDVLLGYEAAHANPKLAWQASLPKLVNLLAQQKMSYEEFVFTL